MLMISAASRRLSPDLIRRQCVCPGGCDLNIDHYIPRSAAAWYAGLLAQGNRSFEQSLEFKRSQRRDPK